MARLARLLANLETRGGQRCLYRDGRWHTYDELVPRIAFWRQHLSTLALDPGSVVGLEADYSLDSIGLLLAAWAEHLIVALVPRAEDPEVCLRDSSAVGSFRADASGAPVWAARAVKTVHPLLDRLKSAGDPGIIIFTSGSTAQAKAALHSVDRFLRKFDRPGRALRTLAFLHFDHVAGVDTLLYTLAAGGALVVASDRAPRAICALIEAAEVQVLSTSPSFLRLLWASGAADGRNLSSLAVITYGSEPMDAGTLRRINELFPAARISQKYGTTETGAPRTISRSNDSLWVQIGGDGVETQIRDGILWIRSAGTFLGYLNAPTPFDDEGWYCTGDLVEQDGQWLRILGREGDTINVGGEKVSPVEVEQVILELDEVSAVAVSGRTHPLMGQIVTARVSLRPGVDAAKVEALVRRHCRSRLPRHKVPVTVDVATGPLSSDRQKILRRDTRVES
jgi:acyl-coenzyme A synthetase/AMP-(fatty) acid ligase